MRVRFAPSPTGVLHIGGARTALYNWLLARGSGGQFVLRIEDTDRERSTPENVELILDALRWLELDWDEGPLSQWERRERHAEAVQQMLDSGHAYEDEGAVRFRVPEEGEITFHDVVLGDVTNPYSRHQGLRDPALGRQPALQPRRGGRRPRHGRHARGARTGPRVEHAPPADDAACARGRAAGVRAHPAAPRARRQEALEAPRRGVGAGGARRRATCRRRCATTSRCSAGATTRAPPS